MADPARKLRTCQEKQAKREAEAMLRASLFVLPPKRGELPITASESLWRVEVYLLSGLYNCSILYMIHIMLLSIIIPTIYHMSMVESGRRGLMSTSQAARAKRRSEATQLDA